MLSEDADETMLAAENRMWVVIGGGMAGWQGARITLRLLFAC